MWRKLNRALGLPPHGGGGRSRGSASGMVQPGNSLNGITGHGCWERAQGLPGTTAMPG